jgi:protein TonB
MSLAQARSQSIHNALGSLAGCLVEGDSEQRARERRIRRKALAVSVAFQFAILVALVLTPAFSTAEKIGIRNYTPVPPYRGDRGRSARQAASARPSRPSERFEFGRRFYQPATIPKGPFRANSQPPGEPTSADPLGRGSSIGDPHGLIDLLGGDSSRPRPPAEARLPVQAKQRVKITTIEPAMLLWRVEPTYPSIALQTRREGRVELRAIVSIDGTIQSLEVATGDPMFFQSALDAVRQWRYRPTILNGVPVEVETRITVIYTLKH